MPSKGLVLYPPGSVAAAWASVRTAYAEVAPVIAGLKTGFDWYNATDDPAVFASDAALYTKMIDEGFFTGNFPYKYYTPAQAATLGQAAILALLIAEGFTAGDLTVNMIVHAAGETDAQILAALRAQGYTAGSGVVVMPRVDGTVLTDSDLAEGNADLSLTTTYQDIPLATLTFTPSKDGYVLIWANVKFSDANCQSGDVELAQLVVNGAAQAFVIKRITNYATTPAATTDTLGFYRFAVTAAVAYTTKLQAKNSTASRGKVIAGSQIMAWWVAS